MEAALWNRIQAALNVIDGELAGVSMDEVVTRLDVRAPALATEIRQLAQLRAERERAFSAGFKAWERNSSGVAPPMRQDLSIQWISGWNAAARTF